MIGEPSKTLKSLIFDFRQVTFMDLFRFNRQLIRSKLKRRESHEESQLHGRVQGRDSQTSY